MQGPTLGTTRSRGALLAATLLATLLAAPGQALAAPALGAPAATAPAATAPAGTAPAGSKAPTGRWKAPGACPQAVPVAEVEEGMEARGITVEQGTSPDPFDVEVIGVLDDGIAADLDMIVARTSSPAIKRAGGIWAGMSGSPVYTADGRLLGAVAYGLAAGPSSIAGITPAADMLALLREGRGAAPTRAAVALGGALAGKVAVSAGVSPAAAGGGLRQLPVPLAISGLGATRFDKVAGMIRRSGKLRAVPFQAGAADRGGNGEIEPGGNFAGALSYGDVTQAAIGTTTAVCDGVAVAFGHPFLLAGATSMSAHPASALYVQPDSLGAPFKVANPGPVAGTLDADRLAGVRARLGEGPVPVPVSSALTVSSGASRNGLTNVSAPAYLPDTTAMHLLANFDRVLQHIGEGRSRVSWTIDGTDAAGTPWKLTRSNRYASDADIAFESVLEVAEQIAALQGNELTEVKIGKVTLDAAASDELRRYRLGPVEQRTAQGTWTVVGAGGTIAAAPGATLVVRVTLLPYKGRGPVLQPVFELPIPAGTTGGAGVLVIDGGPGDGLGGAGDECLIDPVACEAGAPSADTLPKLIQKLQSAPRNNDVTASLLLEDGGAGISRKQVRPAGQVVTGTRRINVQVG